MRTVLLTVAVTLAAVLPATAADAGPARGHTVDLYQEQSNPGDTLDDFVVRAAPRAVAASKAARATVCGQIEGSGPYTLTVTTDGYLSTCGVPATALPYVLVNGTAVDARENHFSQANWKRPGYLITPWSVKYQDGKQKRPRTVR